MTHAAHPRSVDIPAPDPEPDFSAFVSFAADGSGHVAVEGDVDYVTAQRLDEALRWVGDRSVGEVVVDFSKLTFAGAACVNMLVATRARLGTKGRRLRLAHVPPRLDRLFAVCGTYFLIDA